MEDIINKEASRLMKEGSGRLGSKDIQSLTAKYGKDDVVDRISTALIKKHAQLKQKAKEIAEKINNRYAQGGKTLYEIYTDLARYKHKYSWSDQEFDIITKEISKHLSGDRVHEIQYNQELVHMKSRMNKTLAPRDIEDEGLRVKESERSILGEILSMYEKSKNTYMTNFVTGIIYDDLSLVAISGEFKRGNHIAANHIHPLLACLFLPKFSILDNQMLFSNIGRIVKHRDSKKRIDSLDYQLFMSMIYDQNDVVCDMQSPITDLRNRYRVQIALWNIVQQLRAGQYYDALSTGEFVATLNACRNNVCDNADLLYNNDEGSMLRKLLSVFSFRPIMISSTPLTSVMPSMFGTPYIGIPQTIMPFSGNPIRTITNISYISIRLPPYFDSNSEPIDIKSSLRQSYWANTSRHIGLHDQNVISSNDILIFYANRRVEHQSIRMYTNPVPFSTLPSTITGFDNLNSYPMSVDDEIKLPQTDKPYLLRSVVAVTELNIDTVKQPVPNRLITGCVGLLVRNINPEENVYETETYIYDPFGAGYARQVESGQVVMNRPVEHLPMDDNNPITLGFNTRVSRSGTIFIYGKPSKRVQRTN
jgi:hypothetical protein